MALNQVGMIGPRAEPAKQEKEQMSDMDKILQGLQLANGVMGIAVNYQTFQNHRAQNAALEDSRNGILSKKEALEAQTKGLKLDAAPTPGAIEYRIRQAEGDAPEAFSKAYFSAPEKTKTEALKSVETIENGKRVTKFVEPKAGETFISPPKEEKPDTLSKVDFGKAAQTAGDKLRDDTSRYQTAISAAKNAEQLTDLASKNPAAAAAAVRQLARASGDSGVMSDKDVEAFGGSQSLMDRLARITERAASGKMTEDDVKYSKEVAQVLGQNATMGRDAVIDDAVNRFGANFGGKYDENYTRLTGRRYEPKPPAQDAPKTTSGGSGKAFAGPGGGYNGPGLSDIDKELAKRGVKPKGASGGY